MFLAFLQSIPCSTTGSDEITGIVHTKQNAWKKMRHSWKSSDWKLKIGDLPNLVHLSSSPGDENFKFIVFVTHQGVLTGGFLILPTQNNALFFERIPWKNYPYILPCLFDPSRIGTLKNPCLKTFFFLKAGTGHFETSRAHRILSSFQGIGHRITARAFSNLLTTSIHNLRVTELQHLSG